MATKDIRVLLKFTRQSDHQIEETAGAVIPGMTGNKNYRKRGQDSHTSSIPASARKADPEIATGSCIRD